MDLLSVFMLSFEFNIDFYLVKHLVVDIDRLSYGKETAKLLTYKIPTRYVKSMSKKSTALNALRSEIPIFLDAVRQGSNLPLINLCRTLSAILPATTPENLKQQWHRWNPKLALPGEKQKPQQIPAIETLIQIKRTSREREWTAPFVPGAENLCQFLEEVRRTRQDSHRRALRKKGHKKIAIEYVESNIQDAIDDGTSYGLWEMLPDELGQNYAEAIVKSLGNLLIFSAPEPKKTGVPISKKYIGQEDKDALHAAADMVRDIIVSFTEPLKKYESALRMELAQKNAERIKIKVD